MINPPLVSVLMTVYNREKYIAEAIESVISSTYQNWELIIVDDQSKDRSVEIAQSYEAKDERIKVYINGKNLGDYPNRNKAASYAKGKYLKYLDSDDLIYPHGLSAMVFAMEKFPEASLGITYHKTRMNRPLPIILQPSQVYKQQFIGTGLFFTGPTGAIIKREIFEELGGLSEIRYTGDFDSWLRLTKKHPLVIFQPSLIWWRNHEGQEFEQGQDYSKYLKSTTEISIKHITDVESPLTKKENLIAYHTLRRRHARMFLHQLSKGKIRSAFKYFKYSSAKPFDIFLGIKKVPIAYDFQKQ